MSLKSKAKRICMIAICYYPTDPRIRREAEALASVGYEVDILCCRLNDTEPRLEKFGNVTAYRIMRTSYQDTQLKFILQSVLFISVALFRLQILAIKRKYLLIQTHNLPDYLIFASTIQKLLRIKIVLDIHDPSVDLYEERYPDKKNNILKKILVLVERLSCRMSDHLITVSNECKNRLVSRGNNASKITVVMNTANVNDFDFNSSAEFKKITRNVKIVYHGTIMERFGLHNAIKAMKYIAEDIPESILNIYGRYETSYRTELEKLIKELNLTNNVFLHGLISKDQVAGLINDHDIGVVPYLKTDYMNIALPTKAFEYMASGIPVVATSLLELVNTFDERCVSYINESDPEEIAEAVRYLCQNPEEAKQQVNLAYQQLEKISGKVMMDRYISLINELTTN